MNNLNRQSLELEWVEQVRQLMLELARASLGDIPKLPENFSQKALPLANKAQTIQDTWKTDESSVKSPELQWVEQVRQLLFELTRISLAERPKFPENLSVRAIRLADQAQQIKEQAQRRTEENPTVERSISRIDDQLPSTSKLLDLLQNSLKIELTNSSNPEAREWQHLLNLVEIARFIYQQINE